MTKLTRRAAPAGPITVVSPGLEPAGFRCHSHRRRIRDGRSRPFDEPGDERGRRHRRCRSRAATYRHTVTASLTAQPTTVDLGGTLARTLAYGTGIPRPLIRTNVGDELAVTVTTA